MLKYSLILSLLFPGSEGVVMEAEVSLKEQDICCQSDGKGDEASTEQTSQTDGENSSSQVPDVSNGDDSDEGKEMVELKIIWNKNKYDLKIPLDGTGAKLKEKIHSLTGNLFYLLYEFTQFMRYLFWIKCNET